MYPFFEGTSKTSGECKLLSEIRPDARGQAIVYPQDWQIHEEGHNDPFRDCILQTATHVRAIDQFIEL